MLPNDELSELKDRISQMSDKELLDIVEVEYEDYRREAIDLAEQELTKRSIPFEKPVLNEVEDDAEDGESVTTESTVSCANCGRKMRAGLLFADKELTVLFPNNNEERFIQVLVCPSCGDVKLTVDLFTDVEG